MVHRFIVGPIGENAYILANLGQPLVIVDPGAEPELLLKEAMRLRSQLLQDQELDATNNNSASSNANNCKKVAIILTHGHLDHVAGLPGLLLGLKSKGLEVIVYAPVGDKDYFGAKAKETNLLVFTDIGALAFFKKHWVEIPEADVYYDDDYEFPELDIKAIHTPGHTRGSSCLLAEGSTVLLSGDTLFRSGIGRTDNFDADEKQIIKSITEKLCVLADNVIVYPGHGEPTTIARERPYFFS